MVTKSSSAAVVSITQDMAVLFGSYDPIAEQWPSRIRKCWIRSRNPATLCAVLCLSSINSNGKAVSTPVQTCLLAIRDKGKLRHDTFIEACITDANNFEKSIQS